MLAATTHLEYLNIFAPMLGYLIEAIEHVPDNEMSTIRGRKGNPALQDLIKGFANIYEQNTGKQHSMTLKMTNTKLIPAAAHFSMPLNISSMVLRVI